MSAQACCVRLVVCVCVCVLKFCVSVSARVCLKGARDVSRGKCVCVCVCA